jgi:hypothetical protein
VPGTELAVGASASIVNGCQKERHPPVQSNAVVGLLVGGVECLSGRIHEHATRVADLLDRQGGVVA